MAVDPRIDRLKLGEVVPTECTYLSHIPTIENRKYGYPEPDKLGTDYSYDNPDNPRFSPMLSNTTESIKTYYRDNKGLIVCDDPPTYNFGQKSYPVQKILKIPETCPYVAFKIPAPYWSIASFAWFDHYNGFRIIAGWIQCRNDFPTYGPYATFYYPVTLRLGQENTWEWVKLQNWLIEGVTESYGGSAIQGKQAIPDQGPGTGTLSWFVEDPQEPPRVCPPNFWQPTGGIVDWDCGVSEFFCGILGGTADWQSDDNARLRTQQPLYLVLNNATNTHPDPQNRLNEKPIGPPEYILKTDPEWQYYGRYNPGTAVLYDKDIYWPFVECDGEYLGHYIGE